MLVVRTIVFEEMMGENVFTGYVTELVIARRIETKQ